MTVLEEEFPFLLFGPLASFGKAKDYPRNCLKKIFSQTPFLRQINLKTPIYGIVLTDRN
jgi:hypothetical protein